MRTDFPGTRSKIINRQARFETRCPSRVSPVRLLRTAPYSKRWQERLISQLQSQLRACRRKWLHLKGLNLSHDAQIRLQAAGPVPVPTHHIHPSQHAHHKPCSSHSATHIPHRPTDTQSCPHSSQFISTLSAAFPPNSSSFPCSFSSHLRV
jgi:hypothetical protein